MQPYVSDFYDNYLKSNNQPGALATYNEVSAWLISFRKKYGEESLLGQWAMSNRKFKVKSSKFKVQLLKQQYFSLKPTANG